MSGKTSTRWKTVSLSMRRGEIHLASFPYGDAPVMKLRPVLLLTGRVGAGNEIVVAYLSSVVPTALLGSDMLLDPSNSEHQSTRLKTVSVLRLHKVATIHTTSVKRYVGKITATTQHAVDDKLRALLCL